MHSPDNAKVVLQCVAVLCCSLVYVFLKLTVKTRQVRLIQDKWQHIVLIFTNTITGKSSSQMQPLCSSAVYIWQCLVPTPGAGVCLKFPLAISPPSSSRGSSAVCVLFAKVSVSAFLVIIMTEWEGHSLIRNAILRRSHCDFYFQVLESGNPDWSQSRTDYGFFLCSISVNPACF